MKTMRTAAMTERAVNPNQTEDEETMTYLYGYTVALEPGEAAPDFANHPDVEEADTGWDKIERVNRIAYTTTNQEVAKEHAFALLDVEDVSGYTSWGTFDCDMIEYGEYVQMDAEGNPVLDAQGKEVPTDIYTDEGAASALEAHVREAERQAAEAAAREAQRKDAEAVRDARFAELLQAAGIEPTPWALDTALKAAYFTRDRDRYGKNHKFSKHYDAHGAPEAQAAKLEAQQVTNRLVGDAVNKVHGRAAKILNAVRASEGKVLALLEQIRQAAVQS